MSMCDRLGYVMLDVQGNWCSANVDLCVDNLGLCLC